MVCLVRAGFCCKQGADVRVSCFVRPFSLLSALRRRRVQQLENVAAVLSEELALEMHRPRGGASTPGAKLTGFAPSRKETRAIQEYARRGQVAPPASANDPHPVALQDGHPTRSQSAPWTVAPWHTIEYMLWCGGYYDGLYWTCRASVARTLQEHYMILARIDCRVWLQQRTLPSNTHHQDL